jgi:hypothetical protein
MIDDYLKTKSLSADIVGAERILVPTIQKRLVRVSVDTAIYRKLAS